MFLLDIKNMYCFLTLVRAAAKKCSSFFYKKYTLLQHAATNPRSPQLVSEMFVVCRKTCMFYTTSIHISGVYMFHCILMDDEYLGTERITVLVEEHESR